MRTISFSGAGGALTLTGPTGAGDLGVGGEVSRVFGVRPIYGTGAPGTTVFTLTNSGRTLFTSPAGNTSVYYPILESAYGTAGTVLTTGNPYVECIVSGSIHVAISGAAAGAGYDILIYLLDC